MNIIMPNKEEKERAINKIVSQGMGKRRHMVSVIFSLLQEIGLCNLFHGTVDCIFLAILCTIALDLMVVVPMAVYHNMALLGLFFISPMLYGFLHLFTLWKEQQEGLYELKMTCRYTLHELTALRMLFFGGLSVVGNRMLMLFFLQKGVVMLSFLKLLSVSLSALFLYGFFNLLVLSYGKKLWSQMALMAGWSIAFMLLTCFGVPIDGWIGEMPTVVLVMMALLLAGLNLYQYRSYVFVGVKVKGE